MRLLGNVLWHFPFFGFITAGIVYLWGLLLTATVVAAPIGLGLMEYGKFLFGPFSHSMIKASDLASTKNAAWNTYSNIVTILYFPFGLLFALVTVFQIFLLFITILGIPLAVILAKSLGTLLNPVNKKCVSAAVAQELERNKAQQAIHDAKSQNLTPGSEVNHSASVPAETRTAKENSFVDSPPIPKSLGSSTNLQAASMARRPKNEPIPQIVGASTHGTKAADAENSTDQESHLSSGRHRPKINIVLAVTASVALLSAAYFWVRGSNDESSERGEAARDTTAAIQQQKKARNQHLAFADLHANVASIRFYERGYENTPREQISYGKSFPQSKSRYIAWELNLEHAMPSQRVNFQIDFSYRDSSGQILGGGPLNTYVDPTWSSSYHHHSFGWPNAGSWKPGTYRVELKIDGVKVGEDFFTISNY